MFEQIIKSWNSLSNQKKFVIVVALIALFVTVIYFIIKLTSVPTSVPTSPKKGQALKSATSTVVIPKFLSSDDNGNISLFDLDKHTTENDFSALSLSTPGNVNVEGKLCIGSTCFTETDLRQLILDSDVICTYKPSQVFNLIAKNNLGKTFRNKFTKSRLPTTEQNNDIIWGTIVTETPPDNNARIKQTIYCEFFPKNVMVRFSKNIIIGGTTSIFTNGTYTIATPDNDVWEPFKVENAPFIQGSNGLLMKNWKFDDNNGLRVHYDEDKDVVASKTGYDETTQKFLVQPDGKGWMKSQGYLDDVLRLNQKYYMQQGDERLRWYDAYMYKDNRNATTFLFKKDNI